MRVQHPTGKRYKINQEYITMYFITQWNKGFTKYNYNYIFLTTTYTILIINYHHLNDHTSFYVRFDFSG